MVIGFDGSRAFTPHRTGTENYSFSLLKGLAKVDKDNSYHIFIRPNISAEEINKSANWPANIQFVAINLPYLWTQLGLAWKTFTTKLDVLFVPSHTLPLIRPPRLKTVITVHDLGSEFLPQKHQLKQRLYLKMMTQYQLKTASHIIAVSEATKQDLIAKVGISEDRITVVYESYDKNLFKPVKRDQQLQVLSKYSLESGKYFLFVGTIQPRKNLSRLIEAYAKFIIHANRSEMTIKLPKLILAGSKGWLSDEIYALPEKLGISDYVKFLGFVPDEDLPTLYSGAIAFLFPSLFEGFGIPILEAFACGCPVITSNVSSVPEVASEAAILVNPDSTEGIVQAIINIYEDKNLQSKLSRLGFQQAKKFSWDKAVRQTLEVLKNVIDH